MCVPQRNLFSAVLVVADLLHPLDVLAIELFLYRDVRQGRGR
jgi:hypothetical protein